ncbi:MAG: peptidyl-prolyl cis-trans isomerase [Candidatus Omnitrophica bacterium]|nr:peptidyl-prolyl cis-trans isomerase [Candidatus Omnitrophota bacterium]
MDRKIKAMSVFVVFCLMFMPVLAHADNSTIDAIIAIVNDNVITLKDLRQYLSAMAQQIRNADKSSQDFQRIMQEYQDKGLEKLINDKLVLAAAVDKGIEVRDEIVVKRLAEIRSHYPTEDDFIKAISVDGLSISDLKQRVIDQLKIKYEVDMEVRDKITVNPQDVTAYYNNHINEFNHNPKVNVQSIFVSYKKYSQEQAQTRAQEARRRLLEGGDFDKVSLEYSDGSSIGVVEQGQMVDKVENVIFHLNVGDISEPVAVDNGVYVFKVTARTNAQQEPLDQVRDAIYNKLLDDQFKTRFNEWIEQLRKKAYIEIK